MKQRRVGTFTLGLILILIGIFIPVSLIFKQSAILIMQLAPLVLVALGIEVLICAIRFKGEKLKYDGLSMFFAIMITFVSTGIASTGPYVNNVITAERDFHAQQEKYQEEYDTFMIDNDLNGSCLVSNISWGNHLGRFDNLASYSKENQNFFLAFDVTYAQTVTLSDIKKDALLIAQKVSQDEKITDISIAFYDQRANEEYGFIELRGSKLRNCDASIIEKEFRSDSSH